MENVNVVELKGYEQTIGANVRTKDPAQVTETTIESVASQ